TSIILLRSCIMATASKQWEMRFVIGLRRDPDDVASEDVYIAQLFGETVESLRQEVCAYLKEHQPNHFETFGDHIVGGKCYMLSDGNTNPGCHSSQVTIQF